jgi:hypothetical protein
LRTIDMADHTSPAAPDGRVPALIIRCVVARIVNGGAAPAATSELSGWTP